MLTIIAIFYMMYEHYEAVSKRDEIHSELRRMYFSAQLMGRAGGGRGSRGRSGSPTDFIRDLKREALMLRDFCIRIFNKAAEYSCNWHMNKFLSRMTLKKKLIEPNMQGHAPIKYCQNWQFSYGIYAKYKMFTRHLWVFWKINFLKWFLIIKG